MWVVGADVDFTFTSGGTRDADPYRRGRYGDTILNSDRLGAFRSRLERKAWEDKYCVPETLANLSEPRIRPADPR